MFEGYKSWEMLIVLFLWAAYVALGIFFARQAWEFTKTLKRNWMRKSLLAMVLSIFFSPMIIPGGHGAAIGPAWIFLAFFGGESAKLTRIALASLSVCWLLIFMIALLLPHLNDLLISGGRTHIGGKEATRDTSKPKVE